MLLRKILLLLIFIPFACAQKPALVFTEYGSSAYSQKSILLYKKALKSAGLKEADLLYTCYVKDVSDHNIDCSSFDSPRLHRIKELTKDLKSEEMKVTLRFYVDLKDQKWRAYWHPTKVKKAFTLLKEELIKFATMAQEAKADQLIIGSEYELMTAPQYKDKWLDIIGALRKVYSQKLLYAANGNTNKREKPEYTWVPFWSALDGIGINYYPPFKGEVSEVTLTKHHKNQIKRLKDFATKNSQDLIITEVGFPLAEKGIYTPYEWRYQAQDKPSARLRNLSLKLFLKESRNVKGIHLWRHLPTEKKLHPLGYLIDESYLKTLKEN